mmetsp:Transcript_92905/g.146857  ORF Transcript_92905/g.146857 Transcript_92905/m.146857 type:complete len:211 (+) Transcript_92905:268-900(+)
MYCIGWRTFSSFVLQLPQLAHRWCRLWLGYQCLDSLWHNVVGAAAGRIHSSSRGCISDDGDGLGLYGNRELGFPSKRACSTCHLVVVELSFSCAWRDHARRCRGALATSLRYLYLQSGICLALRNWAAYRARTIKWNGLSKSFRAHNLCSIGFEMLDSWFAGSSCRSMVVVEASYCGMVDNLDSCYGCCTQPHADVLAGCSEEQALCWRS